jgi:hypothetical protein
MEERWAGGGGVRSGLGAVFVLVEEPCWEGMGWGGGLKFKKSSS